MKCHFRTKCVVLGTDAFEVIIASVVVPHTLRGVVKLVDEAGVRTGIGLCGITHAHDDVPDDNLGGNLPLHTFGGGQGIRMVLGALKHGETDSSLLISC